jgi:ribosomal-protein-serine acetyltransferase
MITDSNPVFLPRQIIDGDISLKMVEPCDAEELFALTAKNRLYLRQWLPWLDLTKSVSDTKDFIAACVKQHEQKSGLQFCIRMHDEIAGMIGFHQFDWPDRSTSIGYWLSEPLQGRGIMNRSCRGLINFALEELRLNRVEIRCAVSNHRSRAIPEKFHFVHEGTIRDGEWLYDKFVDLTVYGMLARDWAKLPEA